MTTITTINANDLITDSRADINNNFANLNSDKIETSVLDTDTTLAANSDSKIATQKAVKAYIDSGGVPTTAFTFGGDGTDGALTVTSGTTTVDLGGAKVAIKQYSSVSITGTGKVEYTNPHATGTLFILKCSGDVTITSTSNPAIKFLGGVAGGAGGTSGANDLAEGSDGQINPFVKTDKGAAVNSYNFSVSLYNSSDTAYSSKYPFMFVGTGGQSGEWKDDAGLAGTTGDGGQGGGAIVIECAGAWNCTSTYAVSVAGSDGGTGSRTSGFGTMAGGGGGAGGSFVAFVKSITANTGSIILTGGVGGNTVDNSVQSATGGHGGSSLVAGSAGTASSTDGAKTGGDGAVGTSFGVITILP